MSCSPASGTTFAVGSPTTVTCTATDANGNISTDTFTVTVTVPQDDCNENTIPDVCDIASGFSEDCDGNGVPDECDVDLNGNDIPDECDPKFRRGDANGDGGIDISDVMYMLSHMMEGGPAPGCIDSTDSNDDGTHDISDMIFLLNYQFQGGAEPPAPGPSQCGIDMSAIDGLGCDNYEQCP